MADKVFINGVPIDRDIADRFALKPDEDTVLPFGDPANPLPTIPPQEAQDLGPPLPQVGFRQPDDPPVRVFPPDVDATLEPPEFDFQPQEAPAVERGPGGAPTAAPTRSRLLTAQIGAAADFAGEERALKEGGSFERSQGIARQAGDIEATAQGDEATRNLELIQEREELPSLLARREAEKRATIDQEIRLKEKEVGELADIEAGLGVGQTILAAISAGIAGFLNPFKPNHVVQMVQEIVEQDFRQKQANRNKKVRDADRFIEGRRAELAGAERESDRLLKNNLLAMELGLRASKEQGAQARAPLARLRAQEQAEAFERGKFQLFSAMASQRNKELDRIFDNQLSSDQFEFQKRLAFAKARGQGTGAGPAPVINPGTGRPFQIMTKDAEGNAVPLKDKAGNPVVLRAKDQKTATAITNDIRGYNSNVRTLTQIQQDIRDMGRIWQTADRLTRDKQLEIYRSRTAAAAFKWIKSLGESRVTDQDIELALNRIFGKPDSFLVGGAGVDVMQSLINTAKSDLNGFLGSQGIPLDTFNVESIDVFQGAVPLQVAQEEGPGIESDVSFALDEETIQKEAKGRAAKRLGMDVPEMENLLRGRETETTRRAERLIETHTRKLRREARKAGSATVIARSKARSTANLERRAQEIDDMLSGKKTIEGGAGSSVTVQSLEAEAAEIEAELERRENQKDKKQKGGSSRVQGGFGGAVIR